MSAQDALMWNIEQDPLLRSTITSVAILDRPPDRERFTERIARATCSVPRLRQRVAPVPYGLAPPQYVVDEYFDLGFHLRWERAPGQGTLRDVLDFAGPFAMEGFDRARPLWGMTVLEGLEGGRAALVQKLHHSLADGVGAMRISMAFLEGEREPVPLGPPPPIPAAEHVSPAELLAEGIRYRVTRQAGRVGRLPGAILGAAGDPVSLATGAWRTVGSAARMLRPVTEPLSPIMTGRSLSLRLDTLSASLPALKAAAHRVDGKLNDAFVAAVAGGLDRYHRLHGAPVDQLRMTMPINVRAKGADLDGGNQFVPSRFAFPVGEADPVARMRRLKSLVEAQRAEPALHLAGPIAGLFNRLPVVVTTSVFGGMLKAIDVVTSNVPGSPVPIYISGGRLEANFGYGPLAGAACNITLLSYQDDLHLGVATDPAAVPDPEAFVACLADGLAEIEKLAV
jgi:WS/DGAT/MGAT family acyltransferase